MGVKGSKGENHATAQIQQPGAGVLRCTTRQALSKYLELVKEIPEVVEVRLSADDTLCTIISATPHDDGPRYRVFKAEGVVVRSMEQQPFLFDLVNRRELPEGASERLSSLGDLVWKR